MPVFTRLPGRALLRVGGPEARPFLNRLLTQEVETLAPGELRFGALLAPQGRVLFDLFLWGEEDGVRVEAAAARRDDLLAKLKMFRLRAAVTLDLDDDPVWAAWSADGADAAPPGEGWRPDPRTPSAGWRFAGPSPDPGGAREVGAAEHHAARLAQGLPDVEADGLADRAYATEALLDLLGGVDYRKGCFPGQETTSRMKRRGGVRSRVLPLDADAADVSPGAEVLRGELRAGEVVQAAGGQALALLRVDRLDGPLAVAGAPARLRRPAWWPDAEPPFAAA